MTATRLGLASAALIALSAAAYAGSRLFMHRKPSPVPPGPQKRDPEQLDKILDRALEDSMIASDPPSTVQPEVRT